MGNMQFHSDFHNRAGERKLDKQLTIGGGRFHIEWEEIGDKIVFPKKLKTVYFYGNSIDFGYVTKDQFISAWKNTLITPLINALELSKPKIYFSFLLKAEDVINVIENGILGDLVFDITEQLNLNDNL